MQRHAQQDVWVLLMTLIQEKWQCFRVYIRLHVLMFILQHSFADVVGGLAVDFGSSPDEGSLRMV